VCTVQECYLKHFLGLLTYRAYTLDPKGLKPDVIHYNPGREGEVAGARP